MQQAFQVLKDRPTISLLLTRDSVCAGDDCDAPHEETRAVHSFVDPVALVTNIASGYLPSVAGVGHTWDCLLNGNIIATVTTTEVKARVREVIYSGTNSMHFRYHSARY